MQTIAGAVEVWVDDGKVGLRVDRARLFTLSEVGEIERALAQAAREAEGSATALSPVAPLRFVPPGPRREDASG